MTVQEAIKDLKERRDSVSYTCGLAIDIAIESMEKQIPKKPMHTVDVDCRRSTRQTLDFDRIYQCRNCHAIVKEEWNYCTLCGQRLYIEEDE